MTYIIDLICLELAVWQIQLKLQKHLAAESNWQTVTEYKKEYLLWDFFLGQTKMSVVKQANNNNNTEDRITKILPLTKTKKRRT